MADPNPISGPPRVLVAGLGGTIAMARGAGEGVAPRLTARDLVEATPGLSDVGADLEVIRVGRHHRAAAGSAPRACGGDPSTGVVALRVQRTR